MKSKTVKHITISFRPTDEDLYQWFLLQTKRWSFKSFVGRDAISAYRQLLTLSGGDWQGWLEQAQQAMREQVPYLGEENG